jgi:hypothetical protein
MFPTEILTDAVRSNELWRLSARGCNSGFAFPGNGCVTGTGLVIGRSGSIIGSLFMRLANSIFDVSTS